ncbi:hypothetical protein ACJ72_04166 [Emergomyces africanus]|uniref:Uncharacterized protein n=1 Tax=Emergomyces africanus TaxID=1955775 RepID=A0A1B7NXJ6_9EURO|nr:hypothetical protein ACJ72_04166 [Emergomyces africanus]
MLTRILGVSALGQSRQSTAHRYDPLRVLGKVGTSINPGNQQTRDVSRASSPGQPDVPESPGTPSGRPHKRQRIGEIGVQVRRDQMQHDKNKYPVAALVVQFREDDVGRVVGLLNVSTKLVISAGDHIILETRDPVNLTLSDLLQRVVAMAGAAKPQDETYETDDDDDDYDRGAPWLMKILLRRRI